jgi:hypothetical protein
MDADGAMIELTTTLKQGPPSQSSPLSTQSFLSTQSIQSKTHEQTNAAQEPPRLFRLPVPRLLPLQKSTIITRQSSIRRTKNSGTVPGYPGTNGGFE